jgi:aldehyde dehydrogenase (NAD+)
MTTTAVADIALPTTDELRILARTSLQRCGVDLAVLETPAENTITARI